MLVWSRPELKVRRLPIVVKCAVALDASERPDAGPQPSARLHRRKLVEQHYSWVAKLGILDTLLRL